MDIISILGIALGLAMDCFAVAISTGTSTKKISQYIPIIMALFFGFFQFGMVFVGWFWAYFFKSYILNFDYLVAFLLLCFIGIKMLKEGFEKEEKKMENTDYGSIKMLILLSFATSIDAHAVGIYFSLINLKIFFPAIIIGLMSFIITIIGFLMGRKAGEMLGRKAEIIGGLILIFIGVKILVKYLTI